MKRRRALRSLILDAIAMSWHQYRLPPTIRELSDAVSCSPSTAYHHVLQLEQTGFVRVGGGNLTPVRALLLTAAGWDSVDMDPPLAVAP